MGTVYHSILKGFNWILAGLLSLLGFSVTSCGATDEYGSPYAEYELKGKVIDGPENGSFETDSIDVKIEGFEGGKSWFHGKAEVNIPDIKLKEKKE